MLSLTRTLMTTMDEPLFPCNKPCRFHFEDIAESAVTGLPIGVRQLCLSQTAQIHAWQEALRLNEAISRSFIQMVANYGQSALNRATFTRVEVERHESMIAQVRAVIDRQRVYIQAVLDQLHGEQAKGTVRKEKTDDGG
jgi:hypothetical protein